MCHFDAILKILISFMKCKVVIFIFQATDQVYFLFYNYCLIHISQKILFLQKKY